MLLGDLEPVDFVEHDQPINRVESELSQKFLRRADVIVVHGIARVDDVQDQIGVRDLLEGGAERREEVLGQIADEADGVRDDDLPLFWKAKPSRARVEGREELVFREAVRPGERVEQRALPALV